MTLLSRIEILDIFMDDEQEHAIFFCLGYHENCEYINGRISFINVFFAITRINIAIMYPF